MINEYKSALIFEKYTVDEIYFKLNHKYNLPENGVPIKLSIAPKIQSNKEKMNITLNCDIFSNAEENNYPFEMRLNLTGYFSTSGQEVELFVKNAIAILFPYVRAIVSTYTASANVSPLILPAININKLIEDKKTQN